MDYDKEGNLIITKEHAERTSEYVVNRVVRMLKEKKVETLEGNEINIEGSSICIHSDTPNSLTLVKLLRQRLENEKYVLKSP